MRWHNSTSQMSTPTASPAASSTTNDGFVLEVQAILAERTTVEGENEFLVALRPTWIPSSSMQASSAVIARYDAAPKWSFSSPQGGLQLYVPVERGTAIAADRATIAARVAAAEAAQRDAASAGICRLTAPQGRRSAAWRREEQMTNDSNAAAPIDTPRTTAALPAPS